MSIPFLVDEKPTVVPTGSAGERSGGAREMFDRQSKKRKWVSYKSGYNRESSGRSVTHNPLRVLVEPIGIEPTTS